MTQTIGGAAPLSDGGYGQNRRHPDDQAPAQPPAPEPNAPQDQDDTMLIIEEDQAAPGHVYKTVNRRTGAIVRAYSRAELMELRQADTYTAGAVVRTRA